MKYQMVVMFPEYPALDVEQLKARIDEIDPEENPCAVSLVSDSEEDGVRTSTWTLTLGEMDIGLVVHNKPRPSIKHIEKIPMPPEAKSALLNHRSFALINAFGGDMYRPVEKIVLMLKLAGVLCEHGGMWADNPHSRVYLPASVLLGVMNNGSAFWNTLRGGSPMQLLVAVKTAEYKGRYWLYTRGSNLMGIPELAFGGITKADQEEMRERLEEIFGYLMQNGPVLEAGHSLETGDGTTVYFSKAADTQAIYKRHETVLEMTCGGDERRGY